ncbi:hypothetical protein [Candidatus Spongiisocius sp.]|uniref:hypothetical protein n=1 Tax=Candidatus Spongiisocius sp. TaxID=3101273 RepID=UPI003B5C6B8E
MLWTVYGFRPGGGGALYVSFMVGFDSPEPLPWAGSHLRTATGEVRSGIHPPTDAPGVALAYMWDLEGGLDYRGRQEGVYILGGVTDLPPNHVRLLDFTAGMLLGSFSEGTRPRWRSVG